MKLKSVRTDANPLYLKMNLKSWKTVEKSEIALKYSKSLRIWEHFTEITEVIHLNLVTWSSFTGTVLFSIWNYFHACKYNSWNLQKINLVSNQVPPKILIPSRSLILSANSVPKLGYKDTFQKSADCPGPGLRVPTRTRNLVDTKISQTAVSLEISVNCVFCEV